MVFSQSCFYRYLGFFSTLHSAQWDFSKKCPFVFYKKCTQRLQACNTPKKTPVSLLRFPSYQFWNHFLKWDLEWSSWCSLDRYPPGAGCFLENLSAILHCQAEHLMARISPKCFHQVYCLPSAAGLSQWLSWVCIFIMTNTLTQLALLWCCWCAFLVGLGLSHWCTVASVLGVWFCVLLQLWFACHAWPSLKYKPLRLSVCLTSNLKFPWLALDLAACWRLSMCASIGVELCSDIWVFVVLKLLKNWTARRQRNKHSPCGKGMMQIAETWYR